ncbi:MAG TPA: hypothetical protein VGX28_09080 [Frankiaceae bacterium]|jgi:hypothetical protein|nr:hypothetical protein [Frankiaceae bacterium]
MNARLVAIVAAAGAVAVSAVPASAAPKTIKQTYAVEAPVPFPVMEDQPPTMYGCIDGQEGLSKVTREITLPAPGLFKAEVTYTGDWDLYLMDTNGAILASSETVETGNVNPSSEKLSWKKAKKGQKVNLVVCNWMGLKDATVTYTHTYAK